MRNKYSGKVAIIGVAAVTVLVLVLLVVPGLSADETPVLFIQTEPTKKCAIFNQYGDPQTFDAHKVLEVSAQNEEEYLIYFCKVTGVDNDTDAIIKFPGESVSDLEKCGYGGRNTTNWNEVIHKNGDATLICRFNKSGF